MSIRLRTLTLVVIAALALAGALYLLLEYTALRRFDRLEDDQIRNQVTRVKEAVDSISKEMTDAARDYAVWDQTYEFTQHPTQAYIDSNLSTSCESLRVSFAAVVDLKGKVLYAIAYDLNTGEYADAPTELLANPQVQSQLFTPDSEDGESGGLVILPKGPMVIGAVAVRPESGSPLVGGVVAFGKYIDEETIGTLEDQQQVRFELSRSDQQEELPQAAQAVLQPGAGPSTIAIEPLSDTKIAGYAAVTDLTGRPALLLTVTESRLIHQQRHLVARITIAGLFLVLALFSLLLLGFLELMLIKPLSQLIGQVQQTDIEGGQLVFVKLTEQGPSEIKRLASAVNHMLDRIQQVQGALSESQQRFQSLADNVPVQIWSADRTLAVDYCNLQAQEFTGLRPGQDPLDLLARLHPDDLPGYREALDAALAQKRRMRTEARLLRHDGQYRWMLFTGVGLYDEAGGLTGYLSSALDITEDKLRALQVERYARELEQKNRELDEALVSARAADQAKSSFLAVMSHEIRTPLNGVIGILELLTQTHLSEDQADLTQTAVAAADALLAIINDILDFSKIEARRVDLESIDFDLRYVVESAAETLGIKASQRGLELMVQIDRKVPRALKGDPGRLRQILLNLVGNALKFTEVGEILVKVEIENDEPERTMLRFAVKDTGIGVPLDRQHLLFQTFSQVDASTTRKYGGTGLGLAICRQLVEMMGGQIGIESKPGQGSTFWFTARFAKQAQPPELEPAAKEELIGLRVLIVDDNSTNLSILEHQLQSWGCQVSLTTSSEQGLAMLTSAALAGTPFKLAIVDLLMPGLSGDGFARAVKAEAQMRDTLLILMTSSGQRGDAEQMCQAGFSAYLVKPVKQALLHDCLLAVLGASKSAGRASIPLITRHLLSERQHRRYKVLLAEDNPVNQKVALRMLSNAGFQVTVATDGQAAVDAVQSGQFDAVLMDIHMPKLDGYKAAAAIRALGGAGQTVPIVAMTANVLPEEIERCRQAGMNGYLSKPVRSHELYAELERLLAAMEQDERLSTIRGQREPYGPDVDADVARESRDLPEASIRESLVPIPLNIPVSIRQAGDETFWRELIGVYLEETATRIQELGAALRDGNNSVAARHAHTIKGGSAELAAEGMRAVALAIEQSVKTGELQAASRLLKKLEQSFESLRQDVAAYLAQH